MAKELDQTGPRELSPREETHDVDTDPMESRWSPIAMEVHQEAPVISPNITPTGQESTPAGYEQTTAATDPIGLAIMSVGQRKSPPRPAVFYPFVGMPMQDISANRGNDASSANGAMIKEVR